MFLDLRASGFGAAVLGDYDLDISFDPTVLTLDSFVVSDALGSVAGGEALDVSLGVVSPGLLNPSVISTLSAAQLDVLQGASFLARLARLHGRTVGARIVDDGSDRGQCIRRRRWPPADDRQPAERIARAVRRRAAARHDAGPGAGDVDPLHERPGRAVAAPIERRVVVAQAFRPATDRQAALK